MKYYILKQRLSGEGGMLPLFLPGFNRAGNDFPLINHFVFDFTMIFAQRAIRHAVDMMGAFLAFFQLHV